MLTGQLLPLLVPAWMITLAIAVSAQAPPATTSSSASPLRLFHQLIQHRDDNRLAAEELVITNIETSNIKFDLSTPAQVERQNSGVSASAVKAMMTPSNAPRWSGSHKSVTKEGT